jgi:hypothetical protein
MAYKAKEKSAAVELGKNRLTAMKEIDKAKARAINYGDEDKLCTVVTVDAKIKGIESDIEKYNGLLDQADALKNKIETSEVDLREDCARVLSSAAGKFGRDSSELEQLGGTRKSERAKPVRKATAIAAK